MDPITGLPLLDWTPAGLLALVFLLVITDKLIWHKRLRRAEDERDRWQQTALRALGVADKLTVQGEVTTALVASLPDPAARQDT
jgi:hypothetical protein